MIPLVAPGHNGRLRAALEAPVDAAALAVFRIVFGLTMFGGICRFLTTGWIEPMYERPRFFFTYPGFEWVTAWPAWGMYLHYAVLAALALCIAAGVWSRAAAALFTLGFLYTQLIDATNYLNHHYLVVLLGALLVVLPAHRIWSVTAWRDPARRVDVVPAWALWALRVQVGVVYVFAGLAKAQPDWLVHAQPLNIWLSARTDTPLVGPWLDERWVAYAFSWGGFLFDTTIVLWLSWRRTRLPAYVVLCGFHAATWYFFNIGMFPFIMTGAALVFFPPETWRRLLRRAPVAADAVVASGGITRPLAVLLAIHLAFQVLLPLRHHVYPGNVLWNEDGGRFAWHVMLREKQGSVTYIVRFSDGRRLEVPPRHYLTARQEREMSGQPDMILQLARHLAADLRAQGHRSFAIHADTAVSLNGRAPVPLIDPAVDLLAVSDLGPRDWVAPAPTAAPIHLRARR